MKHIFTVALLIWSLTACQNQTKTSQNNTKDSTPKNQQYPTLQSKQYIAILGTAQDAGYPQAGCTKNCCKNVWKHPEQKKLVVSLGIADKVVNKKWMIEATPDFKEQLQILNNHLPSASMLPDGIFLTHGHIGHYAGLMHLGREVIGAKDVVVYAMPKMKTFLTNNGPWSQLVKLNNIRFANLKADSSFQLSPNIEITPLQVPHRDEFTETVGYKITGSKKKILFIPDINKWKLWKTDLKEVIKNIDIALIDGTFYKNGEIPNRDMSQIPHPFIEESIEFLKDLPASEKAKVQFIHFNHTNPLIQANSKERQEVINQGFNIAKEGQIISLDK